MPRHSVPKRSKEPADAPALLATEPLSPEEERRVLEATEARIVRYLNGDPEALLHADPGAIAVMEGISALRFLRSLAARPEFAAAVTDLRAVILSLLDWKARGLALASTDLRDVVSVLEHVGAPEWRPARMTGGRAGGMEQGGLSAHIPAESLSRLVEAVASLRAPESPSAVVEARPLRIREEALDDGVEPPRARRDGAALDGLGL